MKICQSHWPHCVCWPKKSVLVQTVPRGVHHDQNFGRFCWCVYMLGPCSVFVCLCVSTVLFLKSNTPWCWNQQPCAAKKGLLPSIALVEGRARLLVLVLCSQVRVTYCSSGHLYCTNEHWVHWSNRKRNESQRSPICTGIYSRYARNVHSCNERN